MNFSLFFFLHFQGLRRRPSVANLLRRRMGGAWVPGTVDSERMADSLSTSSAVRGHKTNKQTKGSGLRDVAEVVIFWQSCSECSRHICSQSSKQHESVPATLLISPLTGREWERINKPAYQSALWSVSAKPRHTEPKLTKQTNKHLVRGRPFLSSPPTY